MRKKITQILASIMICTLFTNIGVSASTNPVSNYYKGDELANPGLSSLSQELIDKADKYVNIENGEYVLDDSIYSDSMLSKHEIREVALTIESTNNFLEVNTNETLKIESKSFDIAFSDEEVKNAFEQSGIKVERNTRQETVGQNKVETFWWGYYIYLDSYYTGLVIVIGTTALAGTLAVLLPPIAGIAAAVAVAIYGYNLAYKYGDTGVVISWNIVTKYQTAWSQ